MQSQWISFLFEHPVHWLSFFLWYHCCLSYALGFPADVITCEVARKTPLEFQCTPKSLYRYNRYLRYMGTPSKWLRDCWSMLKSTRKHLWARPISVFLPLSIVHFAHCLYVLLVRRLKLSASTTLFR